MIRLLRILGVFVLFAAPSLGQEQLWEVEGDSDWHYFGRGVDSSVDINADGFTDVVVGAPMNVGDVGYVRVFSGRDGSRLLERVGAPVDSDFGQSVAGVGDTNGGGYDDFLVGAPGLNNNGPYGAVYLYSGRNGALLRQFLGGQASGVYGEVVSSAGDANQDGFADYMFTARSGLRVKVFSGVNHANLFDLDLADNNPKEKVAALACVGDTDGDGSVDFALGSPFSGPYTSTEVGGGRVYLHSGADGSLLSNSREVTERIIGLTPLALARP
jgi:hypothetical protein